MKAHMQALALKEVLPTDAAKALLIGRAWVDSPQPGPALITLHEIGRAHV